MASSSRANTAYQQLQQALDAATKHAKTLRSDLSKSAVFKDLEKRITELSKDGRKLLAELEGAVQSAAGRKPAARKTAAKPAARKTAAKPAARKTAARKPAAKRASTRSAAKK